MKNATIITMTIATLLSTVMLSGNAAAAQQCAARVTVGGVAAAGAFAGARERRATRRAKRAWKAYITGQSGPSILSSFTSTNHSSFGLGSRFADLDNAKNVVVNCKGEGRWRAPQVRHSHDKKETTYSKADAFQSRRLKSFYAGEVLKY